MSYNNAAAYSSDAANTGASGTASSACHGFIGCNQQCSPQILFPRKTQQSEKKVLPVGGPPHPPQHTLPTSTPAELSCGPLCWSCRWCCDRHLWVIATIKISLSTSSWRSAIHVNGKLSMMMKFKRLRPVFFFLNKPSHNTKGGGVSGKSKRSMRPVFFYYYFYLLLHIWTDVQFVLFFVSPVCPYRWARVLSPSSLHRRVKRAINPSVKPMVI